MLRTLRPAARLVGEPLLPGDKSMSHRALMLGALAHGATTITGLATGEDVFATQQCLTALGVRITSSQDSDHVVVHGRGPQGLVASEKPLDCGNSGTTMRLMMGLLAGAGVGATLVGDSSLSRRPMARVAEPLRAMGAQITVSAEGTAPIVIAGGRPLHGISYRLPVASGQLKGALLLAALGAQGQTQLTGALGGRDHTERMLRAAGMAVHATAKGLSLMGGTPLQAARWAIPKDMSAAAFWLGASQVVSGSVLILRDVGLNPTRTGFLQALVRMGAPIEVQATTDCWEPQGTLIARCGTRLQAPTLQGENIPALLDELPMLMALATLCHGTTRLRDAFELRIKETDRIAAMADNLKRMGAALTVFNDGVHVDGPQTLHPAALDSFGDHRVAMALSVLALGLDGPSTLAQSACASVSDPSFYTTLDSLTQPAPDLGGL